MTKTFKFNKANHSYTLDGQKMTGVTTILNSVIAKPALINWAANMAVDYVKDNSAGGGSLDYLVSEKVLKEARTAHTRRKEEAGAKGTSIHFLAEKYIKLMISDQDGNAMSMNDPIDPMLNKFVKWAVDNKVQFLESEKQVFSEEYFCAGTFDFSCVINGQRFICDLKTMKTMWDRTPYFQAAAYMKMAVEMGEEKYDGTIIVNINKETNKLTEYKSFDFEADIKSFEAALTLYRTIKV